MKLRSSLLGVAMVSTAIGCSSGGGDGGGGIQGKLSAEQEAALQTWIQSPLKSCEAIEVVGGGASTSSDDFQIPGFPSQPAPRPRDRDAIPKGVDLAVLRAKTKGSQWIGSKSQTGAFAVLSGGASGFTSGVATSKFEQTLEINGSSQSVKVETESSGFDCVVKVNGVERARLLIAKEVEIALAGDLAELSSPANFPSARIATSTFSNRGFIKYGARAARFDSANISDLLFKSMKSETAREVALKGLGFTPEQIKKHFVMAQGLRPHQLAMDLGTGSTAAGDLHLAARTSFVLTEAAVDEIPVEGQARDLKFVVLLATEKSQVGPKEFNSGAQSVMAITRQLRLENRTGEFLVSDSGLGSVSEKAAGAKVAEKCALDRAAAANFIYFPERASRTVAPIAKRSEVYGPCTAFDRDVIELAEKSGSMQLAMNTVYRSIQPVDLRSTGFSFEDWSDSISNLLVKGLQAGSTDRLADPLVIASPIMMVLDQMMLDIRLEASGAALSQDYRQSLANLVTGLSEAQLSTANQVSPTFVRGMARTAIRSGAGFESSFEGLVRIALQDWRRANSMVVWADSMMTSGYIATARAVSAEAGLIGYRPYFDEVHSRLFEVQPSENDLLSQLNRFRGFRTQLDRFPQLKPVADVISTALLKSRVQPADYSRTIEAAAKLAVGDADLVAVYMNTLKTGDGVTEFDAIRTWALALTPSDQQAMANVMANGRTLGLESESRQKLRDAVTARASGPALQAMANAGGLAKSFIAAEASRASGSTRDTFYESKAKELAKRIFLQSFSASDVQSLEAFAKVAGSDLMCEGRQTISSRLDCVGLQRFTKEGDGLLSDRFQGRYVALANRMQVWFGQLMPVNDHLTIRRKLKSALFPTFNDTPWASCDAASYQVKFQALDKAVGSYLVAIGDFVTRSRAEREVQTALDARCP